MNIFGDESLRNLHVKKRREFWLNSVYRKFFIYVHKLFFVPQTSDFSEKLALIFLYNFHREHSLLKLKIKKLSPKTNVKKHKTRVVLFICFGFVYLFVQSDWPVILGVQLYHNYIQYTCNCKWILSYMSWWGRESFNCLPDVMWLLGFCGYSSRFHVSVCSVFLWYFLITLTCLLFAKLVTHEFL